MQLKAELGIEIMADKQESSTAEDTSTRTSSAAQSPPATQAGKRKFVIAFDGQRAYVIQGELGGQVPDILGGHWTSKAVAQTAIDAYMKQRDKPKRTYRKDTAKKAEA